MTTFIPSRWLITTALGTDDADVFPVLQGRQFLTLKTPTFSTGVKQAMSGRSVRTAFWTSPLWKFTVAHEFLRDRPPTAAELHKLWGFFSSRLGGFAGWYFYDPYDNACVDQSFGTGDGTTTAFQLTRDVGQGTTFTFSEPVYGLRGTPTIKVNGGATAAFTYSSTQAGGIVFNSAPANGATLTWSGSFMFLCRFSDDQTDTAQMVKDLWSSQGLNFESLKP